MPKRGEEDQCEHSRARITCVQDAADHSRPHYAEHGQQLQVPTQDTAAFHMRHVLPCQAALDKNLPRKHRSGGGGGFLRGYQARAASAQIGQL